MLIKLGTNHSWVKRIKICLNKGFLLPMGDNQRGKKGVGLFKHLILKTHLGQKSSGLLESFLDTVLNQVC
jgi:hypothetical protein